VAPGPWTNLIVLTTDLCGSFDLNYENNILFHDPALTGAKCERQQEYIARSNRVTKEAVATWPMSRRLWTI
jgi:cardiolipin synthase A/B